MNVNINAQEAEQVFRSAIEQVQSQGWTPAGPHSGQIQAVISGTHKTYRYILLNGLLAKATNGDCNPIVLQAGSGLDGAFDARSLCHNVVVPIERELLDGRLGASNEPFLNKPARFPELSTSNAVRRGSDMNMLQKTIEVLSNTNTSEQALVSLNDCIYWVFQRETANFTVTLPDDIDGFEKSSLVEFAKELVSKSMEGETCALLASISFDIAAYVMGNDLEVKMHKVNQAGSSSNEISDIDVYENGNLKYTAEVKDKEFTAHDVEHAVQKARGAGSDSLIFIKGPRGKLSGASEDDLQNGWSEKGFTVHFIGIIDHFSSIFSLASSIDANSFIEWVNRHASYANIKDETSRHLNDCISNLIDNSGEQ